MRSKKYCNNKISPRLAERSSLWYPGPELSTNRTREICPSQGTARRRRPTTLHAEQTAQNFNSPQISRSDRTSSLRLLHYLRAARSLAPLHVRILPGPLFSTHPVKMRGEVSTLFLLLLFNVCNATPALRLHASASSPFSMRVHHRGPTIVGLVNNVAEAVDAGDLGNSTA